MGKNYRNNHSGKKNLLILAPHPDDLELSSGLLCFEAIKLGWNILEVIITDGAAGGINQEIYLTKKLRFIRKNEALLGAKALGVQKVIFLEYPDGGIKNSLESLGAEIFVIIKNFNPNLLCLPSKNDSHDDHYATHTAIKNISKEIDTVHQLHYCFWGNDDRKKIEIFSIDGAQKKLNAILAHKSQPIDAYLKRFKKIGEYDKLSSEFFYSPNYDKTKNFLLDSGFKII
jgi:LmbE family N-acetylglucosaminyl deacetylase